MWALWYLRASTRPRVRVGFTPIILGLVGLVMICSRTHATREKVDIRGNRNSASAKAQGPQTAMRFRCETPCVWWARGESGQSMGILVSVSTRPRWSVPDDGPKGDFVRVCSSEVLVLSGSAGPECGSPIASVLVCVCAGVCRPK